MNIFLTTTIVNTTWCAARVCILWADTEVTNERSIIVQIEALQVLLFERQNISYDIVRKAAVTFISAGNISLYHQNGSERFSVKYSFVTNRPFGVFLRSSRALIAVFATHQLLKGRQCQEINPLRVSLTKSLDQVIRSTLLEQKSKHSPEIFTILEIWSWLCIRNLGSWKERWKFHSLNFSLIGFLYNSPVWRKAYIYFRNLQFQSDCTNFSLLLQNRPIWAPLCRSSCKQSFSQIRIVYNQV